MSENETNDREQTDILARLTALETRFAEWEELVEVLDDRVRDLEVYGQAGDDEGYEIINPFPGGEDLS